MNTVKKMTDTEYVFYASMCGRKKHWKDYTKEEISKFTDYQYKKYQMLLSEEYLYNNEMSLPGNKIYDC